jgi:hypothetical protein
VRGRTFGHLLDDHHGDGILGLVVKAAPGEAEDLIAADPGRFYRPAYLGHRGWVGLRLDAGAVDWEEAGEMLIDSYLRVAPKRLGALLMQGRGTGPDASRQA